MDKELLGVNEYVVVVQHLEEDEWRAHVNIATIQVQGHGPTKGDALRDLGANLSRLDKILVE
jgi:hypothetical protein